jgi:ABC-type polysaccharide/polyol phosphate transport system ATPase subunit
MLVRLAFGISTAVDPEILLVDEVLSVGDRAFQVKARERMSELMRTARLLVMVSHDLDSLARMCRTGVLLDHGRIIKIGPMAEVIQAYVAKVQPAAAKAA